MNKTISYENNISDNILLDLNVTKNVVVELDGQPFIRQLMEFLEEYHLLRIFLS